MVVTKRWMIEPGILWLYPEKNEIFKENNKHAAILLSRVARYLNIFHKVFHKVFNKIKVKVAKMKIPKMQSSIFNYPFFETWKYK